MTQRVKIVEVGPRDGLQNEKAFVPIAIKVELINRLSAAGMNNVEATSFVAPAWVPQLADAADVMRRIERKPGVIYSALVPNMRGFQSALAAKVDEVVIFCAASETFSQKNINCSIAESFQRLAPVAQAAKEQHLRLRASVSCALGCPYEGEVPIGSVGEVVCRLRDLGCDEIDLADTIGVGTASQVRELIQTIAQEFPIERLSGHYHDTYGQALANVFASLEAGLLTFHSSVAGLGGCPYAKGATGNVATEDLLYLLHGLGLQTGIELEQVVHAGDFISRAIGRQNASRAGCALLARRRETVRDKE
ncbi:MAG: hydroxymethylglutaryl-CoA lyase [Chthoniobacterales bacterium]